jgi:hypothetical protein
MTTIRAFATLLFILVLGLSGCAGISMFGHEAPPTSAQEQAAMQSKADEAWQASKYARALDLYSMILQGQALTPEARHTALERSVKAALYTDRAPEALATLDEWAKAEPKAKASWEWNSLYVQALEATGRERQAEEHLAKLLQVRGAPFEVTSQAGLDLAKRYASRGLASQAAQTLRTLHVKAPGAAERARFEAGTARMLGSLDPKALSNLLTTVNTADKMVFPYNLVSFEDLRRLTANNPAERGRLQDMADSLARSSDLTDRGLPGRIMTQGLSAASEGAKEAPLLPEKESEAVRPGAVTVALLLPQTGQLRALAAKVLAGAEAAKTLLAAQGVQVDIRVINTDDPNFVDQLTALPREVTLVGGPMHPSYFKNLPASGELSRRVFLTFLPEVAGAEEGKQVWRFFWSPEDEVNAVLNIPIEEGVKRYGVLYPEDRMGKRLADAFTAAVTARGGEVTSSQSYPPQDVPKWEDIVKNMVRAVPQGSDGKTFTSRPDFDAIYIPDELQRADHMIGQLHYFQADQLFVLGPQLWSTAIVGSDSKPIISQANYRYAFCPGAWWPQAPSKAAADLKAQLAAANQGVPGFWSALGFDFVRLAATMGMMPPDIQPSEVTTRLNEAAKKMEWALAPISWDASGHASMAMYFFRPSVEGLAVVDKEGFKERLDAIKATPTQPVQPSQPASVQSRPGPAQPPRSQQPSQPQ